MVRRRPGNGVNPEKPLTLTLSQRERGLTELSGERHRRDRPSRLWIQSESVTSVHLLNLPQSVPSIYLWERGLTGVSVVLHRRERPSRLWIQSQSLKSAEFLNLPRSVPSPSGRGLG
ncbi:hypothetical protein EMIT0232MI5_30348 [Pseudomonas sp. IT-232MI5]